jgi:hypothetical protein
MVLMLIRRTCASYDGDFVLISYSHPLILMRLPNKKFKN